MKPALAVVAVLLSSTLAFAGPPALCFPLEAPDGAAVLPQGDGPHRSNPALAVHGLADEVVATLDASGSVLAHTESLRLAAWALRANRQAIPASSKEAKALLAQLERRAARGAWLAQVDLLYGREALGTLGFGSRPPTVAIDDIVRAHPDDAGLLLVAAMLDLNDDGQLQRWGDALRAAAVDEAVDAAVRSQMKAFLARYQL